MSSALIEHLNQVPEGLIARARDLDAEGARTLLMTHVDPECWVHLPRFVEDVVLGSEPAKDWLRGQVVVLDVALADMVTLPRSALLSPIGGAVEHRVVPSLEDWRGKASWIGSPARVLLDADYLFDPPSDTIALGRTPTETVPDAAVAVRRWIAARLAGAMLEEPGTWSLAEVEAVLHLPGTDTWTRDARRAVDGLIREYRELGSPHDSVPGMRGPDSWYVQS